MTPREEILGHIVEQAIISSNERREQKKQEDEFELRKKDLQETEELYKQNPDKNVEDYLISLNLLAYEYDDRKQFDESIKLLEKALLIAKELYSQDKNKWSKRYISTMKHLANSYGDNNQLNDTINLQKQAVEMLESLHKEDTNTWDADYASLLKSLAYSYYKNKEYEKSILLEEKALEIREKLYVNNPKEWTKEYLSILSNLATSYRKVNRLDKINEIYLKSLNIVEKFYNQNKELHYTEYETIIYALANHYLKIKDFKNSETYFKHYFNIFNIETIDSSENIKNLIYPFIKYYQIVAVLEHDTNELDSYIKKQIEFLKDKFENKYTEQIELEHQGYKDFANNSNNQFDKEKLELFEKIFLVNRSTSTQKSSLQSLLESQKKLNQDLKKLNQIGEVKNKLLNEQKLHDETIDLKEANNSLIIFEFAYHSIDEAKLFLSTLDSYTYDGGSWFVHKHDKSFKLEIYSLTKAYSIRFVSSNNSIKKYFLAELITHKNSLLYLNPKLDLCITSFVIANSKEKILIKDIVGVKLIEDTKGFIFKTKEYLVKIYLKDNSYIIICRFDEEAKSNAESITSIIEKILSIKYQNN